MKIIRVFPRRTNATPIDNMVFIGEPPLFRPKADEVHISCTFTWDMPEAERLFNLWGQYCPVVKLGGPAYGDSGSDFTPGMFLKKGFVITSRGCVKKCKHCFVSKREGGIRLLPIKDGFNIADNNLLACPHEHVRAVLRMLDRQPESAKFTGGLDISLVDRWIIDRLIKMRLKIAYIAYDRPDQKPIVERVVKEILDKSGWSNGTARNKIGCYILIGFANDTINAAIERLEWVKRLGIRPYPMFYQPPTMYRVKPPSDWSDLIRKYTRAWISYSHNKRLKQEVLAL